VIERYHGDISDTESGSLIDLLDRFSRVCEAISFAHDICILHRDIKPENVICGEFGEVLVMDWGLATTFEPCGDDRSAQAPLDATAAERSAARTEIRRKYSQRLKKQRQIERMNLEVVPLVHRSLSGSVVGTIGYMSPEQALGRSDRIDERSDIYALSSMLYHILCGKPPVQDMTDGRDPWKALDSVIDGRIVPPTQRGSRRQIPEELADFAMRGIAREPADRWPSASALRNAVQEWIRRQAMVSQVVIEVEDTVREAETRLKAGKHVEARLLLSGTQQRLEGVEVPPRLHASIQRALDAAMAGIAERDERNKAAKMFRELNQTVIESQFGLVMSNLRLPVPSIRRAHDRLLAALKESGVWFEPDKALAYFTKHRVTRAEDLAHIERIEDVLVSALFLMGWVSLRMALVTSEAHGHANFERNAEVALRMLEKLSPDYSAPKNLAARIAEMRGDGAEAEKLSKLASDTPVRGPDDHLYLATICFGDYQADAALVHVRAALEIDPGAFWGHALSVFIHNARGEKAEAYAALQTCQAMQPKQPILWTVRGFLQREYGEFEAAHRSLDRALRYGPSDPLSRLIRADLRLRLGRIDWQRDLDMAADLVTPPVTTWDYFVLALVALYKSDMEYALEFVHAAEMRSPGMPQLYGLEASIMMRNGIYDLAEELLRKALDMAPNDPRLSESLLALLLAQQRYSEAVTKFLDEEERRPGGATPNVYLLASRAFAGYAGPDGDEDDSSNVQQALMLLQKAARSGVISKQEVDSAVEFNHLRPRADFRRICGLLREGPPAPRLFQPALGDMAGQALPK
jgi:tetratricopeptide (TPR) repeat protein